MIKSVRRLLSVTISVLAILAMVSVSAYAETPSEEMLTAARQGLAQFVEAYSGGNGLGADFAASLREGVILSGFQVYTVNPNTLMSRVDGAFPTMVEATGIWRFVVEVNGQAAALVTVTLTDGQWTAVSVGAAELAREIQEMNLLYPGKEGYLTRFVRVYQAQADFLEVARDGELNGYAPFKSGRLALDMDNVLKTGTMISEPELRLSLKDVISENLSNDRQLLNQ